MSTSARDAAAPPFRFVAVLVLATALGPFAMQVFLPALPAIQEDFAVGAGTAQLVFSLSAFAIALATLFYGPISDRVGRRPALIGGLLVYLAGSLACALAPSIGVLILGRIVQAAGGCAGLVLSRAIVRDLYGRERSATVLAYITMAMVAAPMVAPAFGGLLTDLSGWRSVFVAGVAVGALILLAVRAELAETARGTGGSGPGGSGRGFARLLRSPPFLGYALQGAFSISVFFCFLAAAPYLMVRVMGRPASEYGLMFVLVSAAFMAGNFAAARLTPRVGGDRMILAGSVGSLAGAVLMLVLLLAGSWTPWSVFLPTSLGAFAQGLAVPNTQAAFLSIDPQAAGTASGLGGFLQMGIAAVAAQVVGSIQDGTPYPMAIGMTFCAAAALTAALVALRHGRASGVGRRHTGR
ncbi:MAG TPA: multidrug effflux MFS transporter [Geminicoccaceae bacterium]|nr:multidrug effflux MFS transporter [Geminicoccaceae bacterium]